MARSLLFIASAACLASITTAEILAKRIPQLHARDAYNGGWAIGLEGSTCPSDAPVACSTNGGYVNPTCCPKDQKCFGYASPYCCPSNTDCSNVVSNFPVCASSTWSLYIYNANRNLYFCCPPGQYGVLPVSGNAGICKPNDAVVASSLIATPVASQAGVSGGATVAKSTSTVTRTSTLVGGGVTVVTEVATATAQPTVNSSSSGSGSGSGSNSSSSSSSSKGKKSKLSTGAIAGIAIGALFLLISTVLGIWWRRRNAKKNLPRGQEVYVGGQGHPGGGVAPGPIYEGEYKSPAVSSVQGGGYGSQQQMGHVGTPTPPPVGRYDGPPVEAPAPLRFGERAEMGANRYGV